MTTPEEQAIIDARARAEARRYYEAATLSDSKDSFLQRTGNSLATAKSLVFRAFDTLPKTIFIDSAAEIDMAVADEITVSAFFRFLDDKIQRRPCDASVTWETTDDAVATVDFGVITAVGLGTCEIYCTQGTFESNHITIAVT